MRKVQIYVENQLIDLFDDETIEVNSSVQNIQDISKVFTDFSQSFTVPASKINNDVFGFYYNNDLDQFDANTRVACRIEIDLIPFREGKLQLEGSIIKNNQVEAYKISFYGDVVTLKDKFKDEKLKDLDYSNLSEVYSGANVQSSITTTSHLDVRYPLISSSRIWTYNDGSGIDLLAHAVVFDELFPAISDSKILSLIADTYGVTFTGNYLSDDRFKNSYTWWKNKETAAFTAQAIDIPFNTGLATCNADLPNAVGNSVVNFDYININTLTQPGDWASWGISGSHRLEIYVIPATAVTYYIDVYKNGVFTGTTFTDSTNQLFTVALTYNSFGLDDAYTFKARAASALTFDMTVKYKFATNYRNTSNVLTLLEYTCSYVSLSNSITNIIDFASIAPDMKVSEWFSGTLKESNLTCYPVDTLTFQIEPLEEWYANGDTVDITQYVNTDEIQVDRLKMYNEINLKWQKSEAFLNVAYSELQGKEYGELSELFPNNDGGKFDITLPFETMLFNNFDTTNGNLQVAYCIKDVSNPTPYIPKPVKLYLNTVKACGFYFDNGSTVPQLTTYMPFGQSSTYNGDQYSMNFGLEFDSLTNDPVPNSLYQTYYEPYLLNLFDSKSRKVTVTCILPLNILTRLSLDDALIIRDKKYRINDMTSDLTSGVVKLVLVSDWVEDRGTRTPLPPVVQGGGTINIPIKPPRGGWIDIADPIESKFITTSPVTPATNETDEQIFIITVPSNSTGADRYQTIVMTGYYPDGSTAWSRTYVIEQKGSSSFLLTESGGYLLQENLDKILI